jgi:Tol biopolymer transport system component
VAFSSDADNLVTGDTNVARDVFVRDVVGGETTRVSFVGLYTEGNGASDAPAISSDGRYVAFESLASNLVIEDFNASTDIFVRDLVAKQTWRVSVDDIGDEGNDDSRWPSISSDGRYVAFESVASDLVTGDTNAVSDIFVHDSVSDATWRVSVDSEGGQADGPSERPSLSADAFYVAFHSEATNLVAGDYNNECDVFVHDQWEGTTQRVSITGDGEQGDNDSIYPAVSVDGPFVALTSEATNLVAADRNGSTDIFVASLLPMPTVTALSLTRGPHAGENTVVITGTDFVGVAAVNFGTVGAGKYTGG